MKTTKFRPFFTYDIIKTENWLDNMRKQGLKLTKINTLFRTFHFEQTKEETTKHMIIYSKNTNGYPKNVKESIDYKEICHTKNYYIIEQINQTPEFTPAYNNLLARNHKLQYITGNILLFFFTIFIISTLPLLLILFFADGVTVETVEATQSYTLQDYIIAILVLLGYIGVITSFIWMIFTYFKLRKTNKQLEERCGENIDLSFSIPRSKILSKEELTTLKNEGRLIKKRRFGWIYSPDKTEQWLEDMEKRGFNLLRLSKMGNTFYFIIGEKRTVKYHIDYQKRKGTDYFKINEENGWDIYFTSPSRFMAFTIWKQPYCDTKPSFYSDQESRVKHAKTFMLTYTIMYLPVVLMVSLAIGNSINLILTIGRDFLNFPSVLASTMMFVLLIEFSTFIFKVIRYYYRVKNNELGDETT